MMKNQHDTQLTIKTVMLIHIFGKKQNCEVKTTYTKENSTPFQMEHVQKIFDTIKCMQDLSRSKKKCHTIPLDTYIFDPVSIRMCSHDELKADFDAVDYIPDDILAEKKLCPCSVNAVGNCLPSCGSVFAFGGTDDVEESTNSS